MARRSGIIFVTSGGRNGLGPPGSLHVTPEVTRPLHPASMTSLGLAGYLHAIRTTHEIPRLRNIAHELEAGDSDDEATLPLLRMIGLKVVRIERTN